METIVILIAIVFLLGICWHHHHRQATDCEGYVIAPANHIETSVSTPCISPRNHYLIDLCKWFNEKSLCLTDPCQIEYLIEILDNQKFQAALLYRGSRDGWYNADFHRRCDGLGPSVTLFKKEHDNQCIGGFTRAKWQRN